MQEKCIWKIGLCLLAQQAKAHHPHRSKRLLTTALGEQKGKKSQNDSAGKPTITMLQRKVTSSPGDLLAGLCF